MAKSDRLKPIPEFSSEKAEAAFWDTHDTAEYDFKDTKEGITLSSSLKVKFESRRRERAELLWELDAENSEKVRKLAKRKKTDQYSLFKKWIREGIERETSQSQ